MVTLPSPHREVPSLPEIDELAAPWRAKDDRMAPLTRALATAHSRIAILEQRLQQPQPSPTPGSCPRCAVVLHNLERFQEQHRLTHEENAHLRGEIDQKDARIATLEKRVAELETKAHRSAAPFRRRPEDRTTHPKRPGRKNGHAPSYRPIPDAEIKETIEVPLCGCPNCQGPVEEVAKVRQVIVELPRIEPLVFRLITYKGRCPKCGEVRSTHPCQMSTSVGAAGYQLGPGAIAVAAALRHGHGLTLRRVSALLGDLYGLRVTHAGVYEALARLAQKLEAEYQGLKGELRESDSVHADETGWWLSYRGGWLWVFATKGTTVYLVTRKRSVEAVKEVLGEKFNGVLVSDCLRVYDKYEAAEKSKCVSHHLRAIAEAQEKLPDSRLLAAMKRLMKASLKLQKAHEWLPEPVYERGVVSLEERLTKLLALKYGEEWEEKVAQRFRNQREHIFTYLRHPEVEATNNLAERQLRPAVITRKLSSGNATERGARVWEVLASLSATCRQRGASFIAFVANRAKLESEPTGLSPPLPAAASQR